ncbi:MAG: allantoate amidohydrolase [Planctomycetota bacterium]
MRPATETRSTQIQDATDRCMSRCDEIAALTDDPGKIHRLYLSNAIRQTHDLLDQLARHAELSCRVDAAGNWIGRLPANQPTDRVLMIGSHLDTVPNAGKYDGLLGVLVGLAVAECVGSDRLPFHLDVVGLSEEEGVRFSKPYLGSAALAGRFDPAWFRRKDHQGITMREAITSFGLSPDRLTNARIDPNRVIGFIEPHIEQGPLLRRVDRAVGLVTAIAGQSRLLLRFSGVAGHAGTVPMPFRTDALVMASKWIDLVAQYATQREGLCATVGQLHVQPNVRNVIPGCVELSLDVRDAKDDRRRRAATDLIDMAIRVAREAGGDAEVIEHQQQPAATMDESLSNQLRAAITAVGCGAFDMTSGAGHDSAVLSDVFPTSMLFIRQPVGISHHPDEDVDASDVAIAIEVLHHFVTHFQDTT